MNSGNQHEVRFDPNEEAVIDVITRAVAAVQNQKPMDLAPLARTVDAELLQRAVDAKSMNAIQRAQITFEWEETTITLDVDGEVKLAWE